MEFSFVGKTALVTGAGKGIGRAIAKKLAILGARTIALSRTQEDLDTLKSDHPDIQIHQVDLRDWEVTRALVESLGPVDLLVNNAGIANEDTFLDTTKDDLDSVLDINLKALFNVSQVIAKSMAERCSPGSIVNVSSIASTMAYPKLSVYCLSKAAVDMLTKTMATELGPSKIRVNSVNPTVVWTKLGRKLWSDPKKSSPLMDRIPIGRFVEEEEVVNSVLFLLSDKSAMITGVNLAIDGGLSVHCSNGNFKG